MDWLVNWRAGGREPVRCMMLQLYNFYFISERKKKKNKEKEQNIHYVVILISVVKVSTSAPRRHPVKSEQFLMTDRLCLLLSELVSQFPAHRGRRVSCPAAGSYFYL